MQKEYIEEDAIREYLQEYAGLEIGITTLQDRQYNVEQILRNEHNFVIGKDRL